MSHKDFFIRPIKASSVRVSDVSMRISVFRASKMIGSLSSFSLPALSGRIPMVRGDDDTFSQMSEGLSEYIFAFETMSGESAPEYPDQTANETSSGI